MRHRSLYAVLAFIACVALVRCTGADAATVETATLVPASASADSCAFSLSWSLVKGNASGAPTGYLVKFTTPSATLATDTASAPPARIAIARPAAPDSVIVTGSVAAMRGSTVFAAASASAVCHSVPAPLPAPDSVKMDTTIVSVLVSPSTVTLSPGDSAKVTAMYALASGDTVAAYKPVAWNSSDTTIAVMHPISGSASAYVVASALRTGMRTSSLLRLAFR